MMEQLIQAAVSHGITVTPEMAGQFERYCDFLLEYNEKVNLTAITERPQVEEKHFLDSLLTLAAYPAPEAAKLIDVGTGAGFPGVPMKIVRPDLRLTLLDSLNKRVAFLQSLSALLGQENACLHARAEQAALDSAYRERYDIAVSRAVAPLATLCEYCLGFVKPGGVFLALKGPDAAGEAAEAKRALGLMGGKLEEVKSFSLPEAGERSILIIRKISQTPSGLPRKAVKIAKTPL